MAASFVPASTAGGPTARAEVRLRLIQGGGGAPGPTAATYWVRRAAAFVLLVTCVVAVAVGAQAALRPLVASPGGGGPTTPGVTRSDADHVVAPGETLWSVAAAITPAGRDVRATVDELVALNGSASVRVGQGLALPD